MFVYVYMSFIPRHTPVTCHPPQHSCSYPGNRCLQFRHTKRSQCQQTMLIMPHHEASSYSTCPTNRQLQIASIWAGILTFSQYIKPVHRLNLTSIQAFVFKILIKYNKQGNVNMYYIYVMKTLSCVHL